MPELPEVETTCRGIRPALKQEVFQKIIIRQHQLRWSIDTTIKKQLPGLSVKAVKRRAKYLLLETDTGTLVIHLGMSGRLRLYQQPPTPKKHDHVDFIFKKITLRYTDPRRFGAILWITSELKQHPLFAKLGPEPLSAAFNTEYLFKKSRSRKVSIKAFIMNHQIVVGVGNIYAAEALFLAHIHPNKPANQLSLKEARELVHFIKVILKKAILAGGTTLKDFYSSEGNPGYFQQQLFVYGREKEACSRCKSILEKMVIGQRSTIYCPKCQN